MTVNKKLSKAIKEEQKKQKELIHSYIKEPTEGELHDIRVSIRRLRSIFMLSLDFFEIKPPKYPKKRYKEIFDKSSEVRDIDTFLLFLENRDESNLKETLLEKKDALLKELNQKLESIDGDSELKRGLISLQKSIEKSSKTEIEGYLDDLYNSLLFELANLSKEDYIDLEHLHEVRKKCKKVRYKIEATQNSKYKSKVKLCKKIQDKLGIINDYRVWIWQLESLDSDYKKLKREIENLQQKEIESFREFLETLQN